MLPSSGAVKELLQKMKHISTKGAELSPAVRLILSVHAAVPGVTESVLDVAKAADGRTSYEILRDAAGPLAGNTVLDLACGSGRLTELLAAGVGESGRVIGVDLSQSELDLARRRLSKAGNVQLLCAAADDLPLPAAAVDTVFCHMALMLFAPLGTAVARIAHVLRPGGILAAVIPSLTAQDDLLMQMRRKLTDQLKCEAVGPDRLLLGDAAMGSIEDIGQIFSADGNFADDIRIDDFIVLLRNDPVTLAGQLLPFFYHSHLLTDAGKSAVQGEWCAILQRAADADAMTTFQLQLSVLTVSKNKSLRQLWERSGEK